MSSNIMGVFFAGYYGLLQGLLTQLWQARLLERHHVFDSGTGL